MVVVVVVMVSEQKTKSMLQSIHHNGAATTCFLLSRWNNILVKDRSMNGQTSSAANQAEQEEHYWCSAGLGPSAPHLKLHTDLMTTSASGFIVMRGVACDLHRRFGSISSPCDWPAPFSMANPLLVHLACCVASTAQNLMWI